MVSITAYRHRVTFAVLPGQLFIDVDDWVITFKLVVIHEDIPLETLAALQGETVQITLGLTVRSFFQGFSRIHNHLNMLALQRPVCA